MTASRKKIRFLYDARTIACRCTAMTEVTKVLVAPITEAKTKQQPGIRCVAIPTGLRVEISSPTKNQVLVVCTNDRKTVMSRLMRLRRRRRDL